MRKDKRQVLSSDEIRQGRNACRFCFKQIGKLLHFCDDNCFSRYLESILK